jgi:PHD/YefM family antitoxin component YafN of YafNO toxin-antitoxin module
MAITAHERLKPEYIINKKGNKKAVILSNKQYEAILEIIEDLEDANDLLKAEREAKSFTPYEEFRETWIGD